MQFVRLIRFFTTQTQSKNVFNGQLPRYACPQNPHIRRVCCGFQDFASLVLASLKSILSIVQAIRQGSLFFVRKNLAQLFRRLARVLNAHIRQVCCALSHFGNPQNSLRYILSKCIVGYPQGQPIFLGQRGLSKPCNFLVKIHFINREWAIRKDGLLFLERI